MKRTLYVTGFGLIVFAVACSRNNNLLLGRVEARVGSHTVVVTDCYRTSVPNPQRLPDEGGISVWRYMPCKDAEVVIRGDQLTVNGREYGKIADADGVLVDHGVVSIQHNGASASAAPRQRKPAKFVKARIARVKRSHSWRAASRSVKRAEAWADRLFASFSPIEEKRG